MKKSCLGTYIVFADTSWTVPQRERAYSDTLSDQPGVTTHPRLVIEVQVKVRHSASSIKTTPMRLRGAGNQRNGRVTLQDGRLSGRISWARSSQLIVRKHNLMCEFLGFAVEL